MGGTVANDRIKDDVFPDWILSQIEGQNIQKECVQIVLSIIWQQGLLTFPAHVTAIWS